MIELTRLNGSPMVLNSDLIKTAEASPDTMLTLINGEKLIVREEIAEVVERVLAYRARGCWPSSPGACTSLETRARRRAGQPRPCRSDCRATESHAARQPPGIVPAP